MKLLSENSPRDPMLFNSEVIWSRNELESSPKVLVVVGAGGGEARRSPGLSSNWTILVWMVSKGRCAR